ncbi:MAG: amidohydrolase [Clostridiales bacterium]|nr:amidohydrolase [Clostridiales bacterium]
MFQLLQTVRRDLHRIPELDDQLPQTTAYLRRALEGLPCTLFSPDGRALCAWFDGGKAASVAFRADMDALPIAEKTGAPYASCHPGKMHACGHDGHMAMLIALAHTVAERLSALPGNVLLIFQPAEETTGGARSICESGVLERCRVERIYGFHLWPDLPAGTLASRPGPLMARASEVTVRITGRSAHIARWQEGADALMAGAGFLCAAEECTGRLNREQGVCLLKFGRMESGSVRNAVSAESTLLGSLRVDSDEVFRSAKEKLSALARTVGEQYGVEAEIRFSEGYPPVCNDPELYAASAAALPELCLLEEPLLIAEDFSFYQRCVPGVFFLLGTGTGIPLHADTFDFDERVLETGVRFQQRLLELPWVKV